MYPKIYIELIDQKKYILGEFMLKQSWFILAVLLSIQIFISFVGRGIAPLAPFISEDLKLTNTEVGLLPSAFYFGNILMSIPSGWVADRFGTKRMLLIVTLLIGMSFLLMSFTVWYYLLLAFLFVAGAGYGSMHPVSNRGIIFWFPRNMAGTAMGIKQMGVTAGSALSFLLLIPLAEAYNWNIPLAISSIMLIIIGMIGSYLYKVHPEENFNKKSSMKEFSISLRTLVRNKQLIFSSIAISGLSSAQLTLLTYLAFYMTESLLYPIVLSGVFLAIFEIGGASGRISWGIISDKLFNSNRNIILVIVAVMTALCCIIILSVPPQFNLWFIIPLLFIFGFGIAGYNAIWMNIASECVAKELSGMASGLSLGLGTFGVVLGPPIFGYIIDSTGGFFYGWLFIICQMVVVIIILTWLSKGSKDVLHT